MVKGNLSNIAAMIAEAGFESQKSFSEKSGIQASKLSRLTRGDALPNTEEEEHLRKELGKLPNFEERLRKYKSGVNKSKGRRNGKNGKHKKNGKKGAVRSNAKPRKQHSTGGAEPGLQEMLAHLMKLEGVSNQFIKHVVSYYE